MKQNLAFTVLFILALAPWVPGCISEGNIQRQLDRIENLLHDAVPDTLTIAYSGTYELPFDTLVRFQDLHFAFDPSQTTSAEWATIFADASLMLRIQYDTAAGVVRGIITRAPLAIHGIARLQTFEEMRVLPPGHSQAPQPLHPTPTDKETRHPAQSGLLTINKPQIVHGD